MNGLKHKKQQKNDHLGKWKAKKKKLDYAYLLLTANYIFQQ